MADIIPIVKKNTIQVMLDQALVDELNKFVDAHNVTSYDIIGVLETIKYRVQLNCDMSD